MLRRTLAVISFLFVSAQGIAQPPASPLLDEKAPTFDLPALTGGRVDLEDLRGKIVVLHFGAGW